MRGVKRCRGSRRQVPMGSVRLLDTSILGPLGGARETSGWRSLVPLAGTVSATEWGADCIPIVR